MIIGISGLAGSGKDTCADFLVRRKGFVKVALADPMKRIARDVYGFSIEQMWGPSEMRNAPDERYPRPHGPGNDSYCRCCGTDIGSLTAVAADERYPCYLTPRFALQQLGTAWGRTCYPNTWVDYALRIADAISDGCYYNATHSCNTVFKTSTPSNGHVVIPDIRFKNELDAFRAAGAKLIRVVRPNAGLGGAAGAHVSETEQAEIPDESFDAVVQNIGTLDELEAIVLHIVERWIES